MVDEDQTEEGRRRRIEDAFEELRRRVPEKARESVEKLRAAVADRDAPGAREHLAKVKEEHGWLYQELAGHPVISALFTELALWGI